MHSRAGTTIFSLALAVLFALSPALPMFSIADEFTETATTDDLSAPMEPTQSPERSIAPWVVGGILIGGGTAAAIALSQNDDDDDDDDDGAAVPVDGGPEDATCTEDDVLGTWNADPFDNGDCRFTPYVEIRDDGTYEKGSNAEKLDPAAICITVSSVANWDLDGCTLTLAGGGDGTHDISDGRFTIDDNTYRK